MTHYFGFTGNIQPFHYLGQFDSLNDALDFVDGNPRLPHCFYIASLEQWNLICNQPPQLP
jgi:hypothetical protein